MVLTLCLLLELKSSINVVDASNGWYLNVYSFVNRNNLTLYQLLKTRNLEPGGFHSIGSRDKNRFSHFFNFKHIQGEYF